MGSERSVKIGGLTIGANAPVRVESMLKTPLSELKACEAELEELASRGCELVRVSLPDAGLADILAKLIKSAPIPLMADIHFSHKPALAALKAGCPSIRINPGNMSGQSGLNAVLAEAKERGAVIRIGANGGSLNSRQLDGAGGDRGAALVLAVEEQIRLLSGNGFEDIIISAKSSDVMETVRANAILAGKYPYPLHIGVTEAGYGRSGIVKSAVGISLMLAQGIGDTVRVSLSAPGIEEIKAAYDILRSLGVRNRGVNIISCPTCGRKRVDVIRLVQHVERLLPDNLPHGFSFAVMGCEVNGPAEAAGSDLGIAGTAQGFVIFKKGRPFASGRLENLELLLKSAIEEYVGRDVN